MNTERRVELLARFFAELRAATAFRRVRHTDSASLQSFLTELRRPRVTLKAQETKRPKVTIDLDRFEEFMRASRPTFSDLSRSGAFINVWAVAGLKRNELRNAAVLAWLFDPNQSHGLGSSIFCAFIQQIRKHHEGTFPLPLSTFGAYSVRTECYPFGTTESRVDIVAEGREFVAFIEVKIGAMVDERQINRYLALAKAKAAVRNSAAYCVIIMSPTRYSQLLENVIVATWNDVASAIEQLIGIPNCIGDYLLLQFARYIRRF